MPLVSLLLINTYAVLCGSSLRLGSARWCYERGTYLNLFEKCNRSEREKDGEDTLEHTENNDHLSRNGEQDNEYVHKFARKSCTHNYRCLEIHENQNQNENYLSL